MALSPIQQYIIDRRTGVSNRTAARNFISNLTERRNAIIVARSRNADISGRKPQGPLTKEGLYYSKPKETIQKEITQTKVETLQQHVLGKYYTVTAYKQYTQRELTKSIELRQSIDPTKSYIVNGETVQGDILRSQITTEIINPLQLQLKEAERLGPEDEIIRTATGFKIYDYEKTPQGPSLQGFSSFLLHIGDYAKTQMTGETWKPGQPLVNTKTLATIQNNLTSDIKAWETGDIKHYAGSIISNPYVLGATSMGLGYVNTGLASSTWGSRAFIGSNLVTRSQAINTWVGAAGLSYTAGSVTKTWREHGIQAAREQVGSLVYMTPVAIAGYQVGQYYGYNLPNKIGVLKNTFSKAYSQYMPQRIQSTFNQARYNVLNAKPLTKNLFNPLSPKNIWGRYSNIKARYIAKRYAAEVSYYGPELYPYARRAGLVKARGMYTYESFGGIKLYPEYTSIGYFKWPERDIEIMPHKIPTETTTYLTAKGIKIVTKGLDESFAGRYTVKPLTQGGSVSEIMGKGWVKGGDIMRIKPTEPFKMFVEGEVWQKVYTAKTGPYSIIPSIRRYGVTGITESLEIPLPKGDLVGFKTTGSFYISEAMPINLPTWKPGITVIDHRILSGQINTNKPYSFGGRLFKENLYTETLSFSKTFDESFGIPGKYGFKSIEAPKGTTITYSFGRYTGVKSYGFSQDISLSIIPKPKTTLGAWESFAGDAAGIGKNYFIKSPDLVQMPGGIGGSLRDTSLMDLIKNQFSSLKNAYTPNSVKYIETPDYTSGFWKGTAPIMPMQNIGYNIPQQRNNILNEIERQIKPLPLVTLPKLETRNVTGLVNETRQDLLQGVRIGTRQIQEIMPIQKQIQSLTPIQIQSLKVQPINITPTITTPTVIIPTITPPPPTITPPPPPPPPPFILPDWEEEKRKIYARFNFKDMSLGYRFRKWKTPKLEDILKIKI